MIVGNPFPVIEHPFQDYSGKPMKNENGYLGKPISPGYQSHFTLGILRISFLFFFSFLFNILIN